ncbi:MAG: DNA-binding protein [Caldimonas sp.]
MSLPAQLGNGLDAIAPSRVTVERLLAAARRQIADARILGVSAETRFTAAYSAIRMLADAALNANGYRAQASRPGHHYTAIQNLTLTIGLPAATVRVLQALRRQRNDTEYSGETVPEATVEGCVSQAESLLTQVTTWLATTRPHLT